MTTQPTLAEWLLAQIAEDETSALAEVDRLARNSLPSGEPIFGLHVPDEVFSGARVLAEVEAKRRIVTLADVVSRMDNQIEGEWGIRRRVPEDEDEGIHLLRLLALPYATRDGYRAEWAV
jgi:hypothetical protein